MTDINCLDVDDQSKDTTVKVLAQTGVVALYLGDVGSAAMTKAMPAISTVNPVTLLNADVNLLGAKLASVSATLGLTVGPVLGSSNMLTFGPGGNGIVGTPTAPGTALSVRSTSQAGNTVQMLVNQLGSAIKVNVDLLGSCLLTCSLSGVQGAVLGMLLPALTTPLTGLVGSAVDPILDTLLAALGIEIGNATVWVTGARCGVPVLI